MFAPNGGDQKATKNKAPHFLQGGALQFGIGLSRKGLASSGLAGGLGFLLHALFNLALREDRLPALDLVEHLLGGGAAHVVARRPSLRA